MKKVLALALATVVAAGTIATAPVSAYTDSSILSNRIAKVGSATKTLYKGGDLELEVRKGTKVRESNIKWSIGNTDILRFEDGDRYDDEVEVIAVGKGTTKVTAKNLLTGGKIVYTVKVKTPNATISKVGASSRTVNAGNEFELRVKKNGPISDNNIYWSTSDSKVVKIVDDRYDDEVELRAVKAGKAKITVKNRVTGGKLVYNVTVKKGSMKINRVGSKTKTVEVGDDIELRVKKSGLSNSQIKWYIKDSSVLGFDDGDRYGSEVDLEARRVGTTTVTVKNLYTGGTLKYTVKVVPDYDDDWDDDEWDD